MKSVRAKVGYDGGNCEMKGEMAVETYSSHHEFTSLIYYGSTEFRYPFNFREMSVNFGSLQQMWNVNTKHFIHLLDHFLVKFMNFT